MKTYLIAVACLDARGVPNLPVVRLVGTEEERTRGTLRRAAETMVQRMGYHPPFIAFEGDAQAAVLAAATRLDLVPQVVVVDFTGGSIQSIRSDVGTVKVICYDENETEEGPCSVVKRRPFGDNGRSILCWSHVQISELDGGLRKARGQKLSPMPPT